MGYQQRRLYAALLVTHLLPCSRPVATLKATSSDVGLTFAYCAKGVVTETPVSKLHNSYADFSAAYTFILSGKPPHPGPIELPIAVPFSANHTGNLSYLLDFGR